jgi:hypothetical protein
VKNYPEASSRWHAAAPLFSSRSRKQDKIIKWSLFFSFRRKIMLIKSCKHPWFVKSLKGTEKIPTQPEYIQVARPNRVRLVFVLVFWWDRNFSSANTFFDKEHILISRRYQLHPVSATTPCPNNIKNAHSQKKEKNYKKRKVPLQRSKTWNNNSDTTKTTPADQLLHKRRLQEGNNAQNDVVARS